MQLNRLDALIFGEGKESAKLLAQSLEQIPLFERAAGKALELVRGCLIDLPFISGIISVSWRIWACPPGVRGACSALYATLMRIRYR